jgi:hypothetical protein
MSQLSSQELPQTPAPYSHRAGSIPQTPTPLWATSLNFSAYPASLSSTPTSGTPTTSLIFSAYPASLSPTPTSGTPTSSGQLSRKRKDKENLHASKRKKKKPELTVFRKLQIFYAFLKHELNWTYSELLFHTSLDFTGYRENVETTISRTTPPS